MRFRYITLATFVVALFLPTLVISQKPLEVTVQTPLPIDDESLWNIPQANYYYNSPQNNPPELLTQGGMPLNQVDSVTLEPVDVQQLLDEDLVEARTGLPPRFAKAIPVQITLLTDGTLENLDTEMLLWRLHITSPKAVSLNLAFVQYNMPPGGKLFLYTPDYSHIIGPFTEQDNEEHGQLWTPIVEGDEIVVEVSIPASRLSELELQLGAVNYGYKPFGISAACNVDVACPRGDDWGNEIRSVGTYSFGTFTGYQRVCSGTLVNNTSENLIPYFLTANHCATEYNPPLNWETVAPSVVVYWNYENSTCRSPGSAASGQDGDGSIAHFQTGAKFLAQGGSSDFALLQLDDFPNTSWNLHWAGWDRRSSAATGRAIGIHHPNGAEKRINYSTDVEVWDNVNRIHVVWEEGIIEGGSSGSPLFSYPNLINKGHRIIGQLATGTGNCNDDTRTGTYGRFYNSWNGLSDWLDSCNTNEKIRDGIDAIASFIDVPVTHPQYYFIEFLYRAGYVAGCDAGPPRRYCPDGNLTRAEMSVFVERGINYPNYMPPPAATQIFTDLPLNSWAADWATALYNDGYTAGCQTPGDPKAFCPWQEVTRAETAVFFLRLKHRDPDYYPPAASCNKFADVTDCNTWYADWVEAAYNQGVMDSCGTNPLRFCPNEPLKRQEAAEVMINVKGLPRPCSVSSLNLESTNSGMHSIVENGPVHLTPVVKYGTFLGGSGDEEGNDIAVDKAGNIYIVGYTNSTDLPGTGAPAGDRDAFVAKFDPSGSQLAYLTYLGGSGLDEGMRIFIDDAGNATVLGYTDSTDFPTEDPWQAMPGGERDLFVAKLDTTGQIIYSTYLGGSASEEGFGLVVDDDDNTYITGRTHSTNLPVTANAWQQNNAGKYDAFMIKLNSLGILVYSTYLGGSGNDAAHDLTLDAAGDVYIVGGTGSIDFPMVGSPLQSNSMGGQEAFIAKLSADRVPMYSTYLGGAGGDIGRSIGVDDAGNAYVTGWTTSEDFPLQNPLQNGHHGGNNDVFIAKINPAGSELTYSTYMGGSGGDEGHAIFVNPDGEATITGLTGSVDLPVAGGVSTTTSGSQDTFVARFASDGSQLLYGRYLGGNAGELGKGLYVDESGDVYVTGYTLSPNFPLKEAFQEALGGERDVYIAQIGEQRVYLPLIVK